MEVWFDGPPDMARLNKMGAETMTAHLGIVFVDHGADWLRASMPVDRRTIQPFGRLHGGASVALAETVASVAASLVLDPALSVAVGMEINANHVRPVKGGLVHATATAEVLGRTSHVWTIRITDEQDRLVCLSRMTAAVVALQRA